MRVQTEVPTRPDPFDGRVLLTPTEAARALGISRAGLYNLFAAGTLPRIKLGRSTRVRVHDVLTLAEGVSADDR